MSKINEKENESVEPVVGSGLENKHGSNGVSVKGLLFACFTTAIISIGACYILYERFATVDVPIRYADTTELFRIAMQQSIAKSNSVEEANINARKFAKNLNALMREIEGMGLIVLNKQLIQAAPANADITAYMAKRLGIDLSKGAGAIDPLSGTVNKPISTLDMPEVEEEKNTMKGQGEASKAESLDEMFNDVKNDVLANKLKNAAKPQNGGTGE